MKNYNIPRTKVILSEKTRGAIDRVINSGQFIKGPENQTLAKEFSSYQKMKCGIPVSSGSIALFIALKLAGIGPGDEVITVPNTFIATANAIILTGAKPVFTDINKQTFNMDPEKLPNKITKSTKAIIPVHLYGLMAPMDEIMEIANEKDLKVIEDACQAHGASWKGKPSGSWGDFGVFSFYPTKALNTIGDGGFLGSNNLEMEEKINRFINHGRISQYEYQDFGFNFRLSEIQAAIVREQLKELDSELVKRREIASKYSNFLDKLEGIDPPFVPRSAVHSYYLYTIKSNDRDRLKHFLSEKGIGVSIEYPIVLHKLEYMIKAMGDHKHELEEAESCLNEMLCLPMYTSMTDNELNIILSEIQNFQKR